MNRITILFGGILLACGVACGSTDYSFTTSVSYSGVSGSVDTSTTCTANANATVNGQNANYCIDFSAGSGLEYVVAYAPNDGSGVAGPPPIGTGDSFGYFQVFCETTAGVQSTACGNATLSGDITITVDQTLPSVVTPVGSFGDSLSGSFISYNDGAGVLTFSTPAGLSFTYNSAPYDIEYYLQQPTTPVNGYVLNNPGTDLGNGQDTSIQGGVIDLTAPPVPEPATLAMLGSGLLAAGLLRRRKS